MTSTTSLIPLTGRQNLVTANDSALTTVGKVRAYFKVGGCLLSADFYVIDKLTQDVILGVNFFERSGALLDYKRKRLMLYDGIVNVPLVTAIDPTRAVCTTHRTRIPARHEALIPVSIPRGSATRTGITETLPRTSGMGLSIASAWIDCNNGSTMCGVMNPTSRPVTWPAGHAFTYLTPFDVNAVGINLIVLTDCITQKRQHMPDVETRHKVHDEEYRGSAEPDMPSHADRLSELTRLGVKWERKV